MDPGSGTQTSDRTLVTQLQQGDLEALGGLYDRHRQLVFRTALAVTGDPEAAADLLQDVFLRLYRFAHRIDSKRPLEPWLYRMTANLSYTWVKRRYRWLGLLSEMTEWFAREKRTSVHQQVEANDEWRQVRQALNAISPEKRVVVVLYYINDLSVQEIANILEIPAGTVKSRLHYGREALKKHLGLQDGRLPQVGYEIS
jgi:RNA polymerase sigma-70 factor (ECF subfamily)